MSQPYMSGETNKDVTEALTNVLAETFVLYFKTHSFHWNVEGMHFNTLHTLFDQQYNELWLATDEIAERIRALGDYAPLNFQSMIAASSLKESDKKPDAQDMIQALAEDNEAIVKTIYTGIKAAQDAEDEGTTDMLIARSQIHEKTAWMLRAMLK